MARSHPQHKCSSCILILFQACRAGRAMSSVSSAEDAGPTTAADDRDFSPNLGDAEREQRDAAAASPQTTGGTAAAMAAEVAQRVKGGASSAAEPTAGHARDGAADVGKSMLEEIMVLKQKQKEAREAKLLAAKKLRNAERRRSRLKKRARLLSDQDLMAVISMRNHEKTLSQRDSAPDEGVDENAKPLLDDLEAGPSSGATPKASMPTSASSKHPRT